VASFLESFVVSKGFCDLLSQARHTKLICLVRLGLPLDTLLTGSVSPAFVCTSRARYRAAIELTSTSYAFVVIHLLFLYVGPQRKARGREFIIGISQRNFRIILVAC
jgi:hypothetical protein